MKCVQNNTHIIGGPSAIKKISLTTFALLPDTNAIGTLLAILYLTVVR